MLPKKSKAFENGIDVVVRPSKDYRLFIKDQVINGLTDGLQAMEQVIFKILNTERFQYPIYTWNYGIELEGLFGEPVSYVYPELKRRITEALKQDDRIETVSSFAFKCIEKRKIVVSFAVGTIFGNVDVEKEVSF